MKQGFIKVAAVTPEIRVADTAYNGQLIKQLMEKACTETANAVVFPQL